MDAAGRIEPFPVEVLSSETAIPVVHTPVKIAAVSGIQLEKHADIYGMADQERH